MPAKNTPPQSPMPASDNAVLESDLVTHSAALTAPSYVVAIGASAGGLDALEKLFDKLPSDSGAAFVVIQHLSPDHKSIMDSLLARHTRMPVVTVTHNLQIQANYVYLIPAGSLMHIEGQHFLLTPKSPRTLTLPIDIFFQSLAANFKSLAVGVVLSGTGSDGTRGAAAINDGGGFLLAQEPENAKFDGMPRSIISTGLVDEILPIDRMGERIYAHISKKRETSLPLDESSHEPRNLDIFRPYSGIINLLNKVGGINFDDYKPGTVMRRLERRMSIRQIGTLHEYHELLLKEHDEIHTLRREILIPVTRFFRDPEAYEIVRRQVVDAILTRKSKDNSIRVWCAGTATGEEVYSIAMLFLEAFDEVKHWPMLKIFATDVEQNNIDAGSAGIFPESISAELSPEQLERFFTRRGSQYVVKNELRQQIVFAKHNLITDPPFTKMDLVVCRNVLIYFKPETQQKVLRRLQYALKPNSFLFLGSSETLGDLSTDFEMLSQRHKIWKVIRSTPIPLDMEGHVSHRFAPAHPLKSPTHNLAMKNDPVQRAYEVLLNAFCPPAAILVGGNQEMLHAFGNVNRFLQFKPGQPSLDLNRILPEPLIPVASALLFKCMRESTSTISEVLRIHLPTDKPEDPLKRMRLSAWPIGGLSGDDSKGLSLLVFEELSDVQTSGSNLEVDVELETTERMEVLQHELAATRESLQATIEELETSNEELQATNEEMMASNEELQSSNEELQSVNEELNTVNLEYQEKIEVLNRVNADLDNLAKVVASGTIFLDENLNISRFSADASSIFKLRNSDLGRPLSDISNTLDYPNIIEDFAAAIQSGELQERTVESTTGKSYLVKILPYRVPSSSRRGLVVNFIDISSIQHANKLQKILDATFSSMAVMSTTGEIILCNASWRHGSSIFDADCNPCAVALGANYIKYIENSRLDWAKQIFSELNQLLQGQKTIAQLSIDSHKFITFSAKKIDDPYQGVLLEVIAQERKK